MVEMVRDRIAAGETTVVSTAAVLGCRKQMEKLLFLDSLFPKMEVMCEMLLLENDHKEARRYWMLKEEAHDHILWRTEFGRGYGPIARQTTT
jgi:hypothetical protein